MEEAVGHPRPPWHTPYRPLRSGRVELIGPYLASPACAVVTWGVLFRDLEDC